MLRLLNLLLLLLLLLYSTQSIDSAIPSTTTNKFGIGVYTDTPGSPSYEKQLDAALNLTSRNGFVTIYLCSWRIGEHQSCMNQTTKEIDEHSKKELLAAYGRNLTVVARIGNPRVVNSQADPSIINKGQLNVTSYKILAKAYALVLASLPLPPSNHPPLYVTIGNEFNACNEWRCNSNSSNSNTSKMTGEEMAMQVSAFYRDVGSALIEIRKKSKGRLLYSHGAIASWDTAPCECGTGQPLGNGNIGLSFLSSMLK
jgi:hypothetical protein